jgi:hypothetical protein
MKLIYLRSEDINVFRTVYAEPIMKMREPDADDEIKVLFSLPKNH